MQRKAKSVPKVTRQVRSLIDDMLETMCAAPGVGLAAPQRGIHQRVIVVDVGEGPITKVSNWASRGACGAGCAHPVRCVHDLFRPGDASGGTNSTWQSSASRIASTWSRCRPSTCSPASRPGCGCERNHGDVKPFATPGQKRVKRSSNGRGSMESLSAPAGGED